MTPIMRPSIQSILAVVLLACGGSPSSPRHSASSNDAVDSSAPGASRSTEADCAAYAAALAPCLEATGVDLSTWDPSDNQCMALRDQPYAPFFDCATTVLLGSDCSTGPGFAAAHRELQACHDLVSLEPW